MAKKTPKFYRVEILVDNQWYGICHAAWYVRHLGICLSNKGLSEPKVYYQDGDYEKPLPHIPSKCWFTWNGWSKCKSAIMETLAELNHEYRILVVDRLKSVIYKDAMQVIQSIPEEDDTCNYAEPDISIKRYSRHIYYLMEGNSYEGIFSLTKDKIDILKNDGSVNIDGEQICLDPSHYEKRVRYEQFEDIQIELISYKFE